MGTVEHRRSERIRVSIPILVAGIDARGQEFTEETRTLVLNREGALILVKHSLAADETIRIINLQNESAANFRVVGPTRLASAEGTEWGVECLAEDVNIWAIEFLHRRPDASQPCALLECQACKNRFFWPVTLMESEVLTTTGTIQNFCDRCGRSTPWVFADPSRRPKAAALTSSPAADEAHPVEERRQLRRLLVKLPVLVKTAKGDAETSRSENLSQGSLAVVLAMDLTVGSSVTVICPYTTTGRNVERTAKVVRREMLALQGKVLYGMQYVAMGAATD